MTVPNDDTVSALLTDSLGSPSTSHPCCTLASRHRPTDSIVFYITVDTPSIDQPNQPHQQLNADQSVDCEHIRVSHQQSAPTQSTCATTTAAGIPTTTINIADSSDLTRLGLSITSRLRDIDTDATPVICFHSLTGLLQLASRDVVFRFVHTLNGIVKRSDGQIHYHFARQSHAPEIFETFRPLFDTIVSDDDRATSQPDIPSEQDIPAQSPANSTMSSSQSPRDVSAQPTGTHTQPTGATEPSTQAESTTNPPNASANEASEPAIAEQPPHRDATPVSADGGTDSSRPSTSDTQPAIRQESSGPSQITQEDRRRPTDRVLPELDQKSESTNLSQSTKRRTNHNQTHQSNTDENNTLSDWEWPMDD